MRRFFLLAPTLALGACLFPSLDGLSGGGDASLPETGADAPANDVASEAPPPSDAGSDADVVVTKKTYVEEVKADSPYAWWRLGESATSQAAKDEMPSGNDGAYKTPGVTLGLKGAIANDPNTAMALDGTSGAMYLPGTIFDFGGSPTFAIEVWVSPGAPPPADASDLIRRIVSHRTTSPYYGWFLAIDQLQRVFFTRWENNATVASVTSSAIPQGQFAHVVVSADGSNLTLFVNGAQVSSAPEATITDTASTHLSFGATSDFTVEWFNGTLDEPAIYTHALAPARVLAHYQAGIGK